jgi:hypothetical protein
VASGTAGEAARSVLEVAAASAARRARVARRTAPADRPRPCHAAGARRSTSELFLLPSPIVRHVLTNLRSLLRSSNLPKTSSPLASSPVRPSPPRSPLVLSPQPRRASLNAQASAPWITGRGSLLTEEAGELGDTDDDGGPTGGNMTTPFEETEDEREVWTWSKEV